ncbi:MAG TPA: FtsX-like permease family protein [Mucilaginibacter sp.]|nr:FtsX-like permease family protein [Mucilaginibacter sp.]
MRSAIRPRKVLVVLQFSVAIVLVISTIVIYRQIKFAQSRDAGYNANRLVEVPVEGDIRKNYQLIKNDLISSGAATAMCQTSLDVTLDGATGGGFSTDGVNKDQQNISFSRFGTSGDFIKTMGLKLVAGRDVDFTAYPSDSVACLLNETAVKQLGLKDPIGNFVKSGTFPIKVVGVFKDFIIQSPYVNTGPMIVFATKGWIYNTVIRFSAQNDMAKNLQIAEGIFKKYNSAYPFTYNFVDSQYQKKFNDQQQTGKLAAVFACLTIFISCLGLFGLASYMAENRAKEIGIRKVLGASVASITQMLTREFLTLVIIAIIVATPVAWWAASKWLQGFTYRISIGWVTFAVAGVTAILIAVLTVSYQSIKAAIANPVNSIKAE